MNFRHLFEKPIKKVSQSETVSSETAQSKSSSKMSKEKIATKVYGLGVAALTLGSVQAEAMNSPETEDDKKTKIEASAHNLDKRLDSPTTYRMSGADFSSVETDRAGEANPLKARSWIEKQTKENGQELVRLNFAINFFVDKADISPDDAKEIAAQFSEFLDNIKPENYKRVLESEWVVFSSCSEEQTLNWGEKGNENLAEARGEKAVEILNREKAAHNFSALDAKQASALKNKKINVAIASGHSENLGVTLVTDLDNPDTGEKYTASEVEKMEKDDPEKYEQLKAKNRVAYFKAEIVNESEKAQKDIVKLISQYDRSIFMVDKSGSMRDDLKDLYKEVKNRISSLPGTELLLSNYSDKFEGIKKFNANKIEENFSIDVGPCREMTIRVLIKLLEQLAADSPVKENLKTIITVHTDEALQLYNYYALEYIANLSQKSGTDIMFVFYSKPDPKWNNPADPALKGKEVMVSLDDVMKNTANFLKLDSLSAGEKEKIDKAKVRTIDLGDFRNKNGQSVSLPTYN